MMKSLLLLVASFSLLSAGAQTKSSDVVATRQTQSLSKSQPQASVREMQMRTPGTPVLRAPEKADDVKVWYRRPAGAFPASLIVEDGVYSGMLYAPYIAVKPFSDYTFKAFVEGASPSASYEWDVQYYVVDEGGYYVPEWVTIPGEDMTFRWDLGVYDAPIFNLLDNGEIYPWTVQGYELDVSNPGNPIIVDTHYAKILSVPSTMEIWDMDFLKSSKTFVYGGRYANHRFPMTTITGAEAYPLNSTGWWFGKNGYHYIDRPAFFVDGIAQAFEQPQHPYLLNQVVLFCGVLEAAGPCEMTCRIYKLDEIPAYNDTASVSLPEVPGELIARGRAVITPETSDDTGGLVFFNLYGEDDGLEIDISPTVDSPILVCIDGYNDPGMENLVGFSAMISSDIEADEGFGELAYLKFGRPNADGGIDYEWAGLNNFFSSGTMMTGLTIFLSTELPYLTFNYNDEDGEFTFPNEGGLMEKHFDDYTTRSIEFKSSLASEDDAWYVFCDANEDGEVPEWLSIELTDVVEDGEFTGIVNAEVVADPLPEEVTYREAIVRFEFPGAYVDYKFMQGVKVPPYDPCKDIIDDGEINIADVNYLISLMLEDMFDDCFDVNGDGELTVADINAIIDLILE